MFISNPLIWATAQIYLLPFASGLKIGIICPMAPLIPLTAFEAWAAHDATQADPRSIPILLRAKRWVWQR